MAEPVSLAELKAFARIDHDNDDTLVASLGIAAREFVETATGRTLVDAETPERAKIAIKALATHWYEFREPALVGGVSEVPFHVRRLINQLHDWSALATLDELS